MEPCTRVVQGSGGGCTTSCVVAARHGGGSAQSDHRLNRNHADIGWIPEVSRRMRRTRRDATYGEMNLCLTAKRTNSAAVWTPALRSNVARWLSTVLLQIPSASAIALLP